MSVQALHKWQIGEHSRVVLGISVVGGCHQLSIGEICINP